jgi:hypothetical protein
VARLPTPFPDATVGLAPALGRAVDQLDEELPAVVIRGMAALEPAPALLHEMAVCIELELVGRRVADPDRSPVRGGVELPDLALDEAALPTSERNGSGRNSVLSRSAGFVTA